MSAQVLAQEAPLLQEQEAAGDSLGRRLSLQSPADSTAPPPPPAPPHPPTMLLSPLRVPRCGVEAIPVHRLLWFLFQPLFLMLCLFLPLPFGPVLFLPFLCPRTPERSCNRPLSFPSCAISGTQIPAWQSFKLGEFCVVLRQEWSVLSCTVGNSPPPGVR